MEENKLFDTFCRTCNSKLNAHKNLTDPSLIRPDAILICAYCGELSLLDKDFNLKPVTPDFLVKLYLEDEDAYLLVTKMQILAKIKSENKKNKPNNPL